MKTACPRAGNCRREQAGSISAVCEGQELVRGHGYLDWSPASEYRPAVKLHSVFTTWVPGPPIREKAIIPGYDALTGYYHAAGFVSDCRRIVQKFAGTSNSWNEKR